VRTSARLVTALVVALAVAVPVVAQEAQEPLTWLAYTRVKAGKTQAWVELSLKYDKPVMDKLVADGTVLAWGYAVRANHRPGYEWNLLTYVVCPTWAAIDTWVGAQMGAMAARSPEESETITAAYADLEEADSHFDEVVRNRMRTLAETPKRFSYFYVSHYRARPGMYDEGTARLEEGVKPVADSLMASGKIVGYGMHLQELHNQHQPGRAPWSHGIWYALTDLGAIDDMDALYAARVTPERQKMRAETFDFDAHTDDVMAVLHAEPAPPE
jgi:hypothetical protein